MPWSNGSVRLSPFVIKPIGLLIGIAFTAGVALGPVGLFVAPALLLLFTAAKGESFGSYATFGRILFALTLCSLLGIGRGMMVEAPNGTGNLSGSDGGEGVVVGLPQAGSSGERVLVAVDKITFGEGSEHVVDRNVLAFLPPASAVNVGDRLALVWSYETLESLPPGFGTYARNQAAEGIVRVWVVDILETGSSPLRTFVDARRAVSKRLESLIPGDAGALAAGIVTGDDSRLSDAARDAFLQTGTSHITAVSGQNVAILIGLVYLVLRTRRRKRMIVVQVGILALVWAYTLFAGFNPPSVRAALFVTMVLFAGRFGRRPDIATVLSLTTALMLMFDPGYVHSVSFWLSIVSSAALVTCISLETEMGLKRTLQAIALPLVAAQLATIPITIGTFGMWSVGSLIANALVAPLITFAFPATFVLAMVAFAAPGLAPYMAWIPAAILQMVVAIVERVAVTFPTLDLDAIGSPIIMAMIIPSLIGIALLSVDARRWGERLVDSARRAPMPFALGAAGLILGAMATMLIEIFA